jgi:hypothetical protein
MRTCWQLAAIYVVADRLLIELQQLGDLSNR